MPPKNLPPHQDNRALRALIDLTKTTQTLLTHFRSSLTSQTASTQTTPIPDPLSVLKASTTLLKSHTTTLSLLLLTPPFSPTAISKKIGEVSSGVVSSMVACASSSRGKDDDDEMGEILRTEVRAHVKRVISSWSDVLGLVCRIAEKKGDVSEGEKQDVLSATGVVWEGCDRLVKVCEEGVVGVVVRRAEELRGVLLDAVSELREWGEDVGGDDDDDDDDDEVAGSGDEDFKDEDEIFGAANKLGKGDAELKILLDGSVKKLKLVGVLYQALVKRRLRTFPKGGEMERLEMLMGVLKEIPELVDDLASAFYDLDEDEVRVGLEKCCDEAKRAVELVRMGWSGKDDEFTVWSGKWLEAMESA